MVPLNSLMDPVEQEKTPSPINPVVDTSGIDGVIMEGLQRSEHRYFVLKIDQDLEALLSNPR